MLQLSFHNGMDAVSLTQDRLTVGRDPGNDIVLDDGRVSGFHANIIKNIEKFEIVDLGSSNGTFVNGEYLKGRRVLKAWDTITIGETSIEVVDTEGRRPTTVQPVINGEATGSETRADVDGGPCLRLVAPGEHPAEVFVGGELSIGRAKENTLQLDVPTVSSSHAEIRISDGQYELVDKGSTNGTYVNGRKVSHAFLRSGDRVAFDQVEYLFHVPGTDAAKTTVNPALHDDLVATRVGPAVSSPSVSSSSATTGSAAVASPKIRPASEFLADEPEPAQASVIPPAPEPPSPARASVAPPSPSGGPSPARASIQPVVTPPSAPQDAPSSTKRGIKWLYFCTEGRIPRMKYFLGLLGMMAALIPIHVVLYAILGSRAYTPGTPQNLMTLVIVNVIGLYPMIALNTKRLHDLGRTGAWVWVLVVSIVGSMLITMKPELIVIGGIAQLAGFILGVYLLFFRGNEGANRYGHPYQTSK